MGNNNDNKAHRFGILLVHGIGDQERGDTLQSITDEIIKWFKLVRLGDSERTFQVEANRTKLTATDEPASTELLITNLDASDTRTHRWNVTEAWWAESFPPPTFGKLFEWVFDVLPWTLVVHFSKRSFIIQERLYWALKLLHYPIVALYLALALVLMPVIGGLLILLLLSGLVPAGRELALFVQKKLASILGDSYVFVQSPTSRDAMVKIVRDRIDDVCKVCEKVVVVAHSQGAAVMHEALKPGVPDEVEHLITYGSGFEKLARMMLHFDTRRDRRLRFIGLPLIFLVLTALVAITVAFHGLTGIAMLALFALAASVFYPIIKFGWAAATNQGSFRLILQPIGWLVLPVGALAAIAAVVTILSALSDEYSVWLAVEAGVFVLALLLVFEAADAMKRDILEGEDGKRWFDYIAETYGLKDSGRRLRLPFDLLPISYVVHKTPWSHFYGSEDPISNGSIFHFEVYDRDFAIRANVAEQEMHNRGSLLFDHTSYWHNKDQFVSNVLGTLLAKSNVIDDGQKKLLANRRLLATKERLKRIRLRRFGVLAILAVLITGVAGYPTRMSELTWSMLGQIGEILVASENFGQFLQAYPYAPVVTAAIVAGLVLYLSFTGLWKSWDTHATEQCLEHGEVKGTASFFATAVLSIVLAIGAAWLAIGLL